jgi:hypothetical protein
LEIELNGHKYITIKKLNGFDQLEVFRKLFPLFAGLGQGLAGANGADALAGFVPIADVVSKMPREDVQAVILTCFKVVSRVNPGMAPAPLLSSAGTLMFEDELDMMTMLQITREVVMENLGNFFAGGQPESSDEASTSPLN